MGGAVGVAGDVVRVDLWLLALRRGGGVGVLRMRLGLGRLMMLVLMLVLEG
jgi:hypothetical protein